MPRVVMLSTDTYTLVETLDEAELDQVRVDIETARDDEARITTELQALVAPKRVELRTAQKAQHRLTSERDSGLRRTKHLVRREYDTDTDEVVIVRLSDDQELERRGLAPGEQRNMVDLGHRPADPGPP